MTRIIRPKRYLSPLKHETSPLIVNLLAEKYGIDPTVVHPHYFRHLFAKNFLSKNNDLVLLVDLMGHESVDTTRIYLQRSTLEQSRLVDRVVDW